MGTVNLTEKDTEMEILRTAEIEDEKHITSLESSVSKSGFLPVFRSGSSSVIGERRTMEDEHICVDSLENYDLCESNGDYKVSGRLSAFYGVFDGHNGSDASHFIRENILTLILQDENLHRSVPKAMVSAYVKADHLFSDAESVDSESGTTALTALFFGRNLYVANAGDCRAVMSRLGKAMELSTDHRPDEPSEKIRIEKLGGSVDTDGYLDGQLAVARAIGDWHMKGSDSDSPLTPVPELREVVLTEEDEFLILACDGLWDVMTSQCAVSMVRRELRKSNDPTCCSRELVNEALRRRSGDNVTVVTICFSPFPPSIPEITLYRPRKLFFSQLS